MKRNILVASVLVMFLIPAFALAANSSDLSAAKEGITRDNQYIVPLVLNSTKDLVALDIPLEFSEGARLVKIEFTDRVAEFEFKDAIIDNEKRNVVVGLISMVSSDKPDLAPGTGAIANLVFELDAGVEAVTLKQTRMDVPNHELTFYYNEYTDGRPVVRTIQPVFETVTVAFGLGSGSAVPTVYALDQNSPNPFNPSTRIAYALPEAGQVRLSVFNVLGQHVTDLIDGHQEAGAYDIIWDGHDKDGSQVASGVYFYRLKAENFTDTKKMALLK